MDSEYTMPPAIIDSPDAEEERRRRAAAASGMPPAVTPGSAAQPRLDSSSTMTMPPAVPPVATRSNANSEPFTMPPAFYSGVNARPQQPTANTMPAATYADRYKALAAEEPNRADYPAQPMSWWRKGLGTVAAIAGGLGPNGGNSYELERNLLDAPEKKADQQYDTERQKWRNRLDAVSKEAGLANTESETRERDARTWQLQHPQAANETDKKVDEYVNDQGQRVLTFQKPNGDLYDRVGGQTQAKAAGHTSPFEAFAYGDANEKKAAQDFLDLERRISRRYEKPSELDERYRLFQHDPEAYKAMFGDRGASKPDTATATRMLNYFDKRRREVQQDFTLDDQQKQQQLDDIGALEQPFMDAVQPNSNRGGGNDRVNVISPNGVSGTIPRSQLGAAKKKGYREAQ